MSGPVVGTVCRKYIVINTQSDDRDVSGAKEANNVHLLCWRRSLIHTSPHLHCMAA